VEYFLLFKKMKDRDRASALSGHPLPNQRNNQPKTVPAMGWIFGLRFGRGGTLGDNNYPSILMAI
jgi:hypothetical protein